MVHVYRITVGLLLYLALIYSCRTERKAHALSAQTSAAQPNSFADLFPVEGFSSQQKEAYRTGLAERRQQLEKIEAEQAKHARAEAKHPNCMAKVSRQIEGPWADLIRVHRQHFYELKAEAAASTAGEVACDICDGASYMPCLLCGGSTKCEECKGEGILDDGELCPVCVGSGKCPLCSGFGKMLCPFCNDGMILNDQPDPRERSWLE